MPIIHSNNNKRIMPILSNFFFLLNSLNVWYDYNYISAGHDIFFI